MFVCIYVWTLNDVFHGIAKSNRQGTMFWRITVPTCTARSPPPSTFSTASSTSTWCLLRLLWPSRWGWHCPWSLASRASRRRGNSFRCGSRRYNVHWHWLGSSTVWLLINFPRSLTQPDGSSFQPTPNESLKVKFRRVQKTWKHAAGGMWEERS